MRLLKALHNEPQTGTQFEGRGVISHTKEVQILMHFDDGNNI